MKLPETDLGVPAFDQILDRYLDRPRLDQYFALLMEHNARVNLVSRETSRPDFDRLVAESLLPLEHMKTPVNGYLDIGAGGGFPSLPLLLSGKITGDAILVERTGKKARALESLLSQLNLSARVLPNNFEEVKDLPKVQLITLRLVKLDKPLLSRIEPLLKPAGVLAYYSRPEFPTLGWTRRTFVYRASQGSAAKSLTLFQK